MVSMKNGIITLIFKANKADIGLIDPNMLKKMFVCKPTISLLEEIKYNLSSALLRNDINSGICNFNRLRKKAMATRAQKVDVFV